MSKGNLILFGEQTIIKFSNHEIIMICYFHIYKIPIHELIPNFIIVKFRRLLQLIEVQNLIQFRLWIIAHQIYSQNIYFIFLDLLFIYFYKKIFAY